jgi:hypothetical protein
VLTMLWLPVLLLDEALHPRPRYDVRRWSTVFPVGMYAACSFAVATRYHRASGRARSAPTQPLMTREIRNDPSSDPRQEHPCQ